MTIRYTIGLTIEDQLDCWANGNITERELEKWLRQHLVDIEDQQSRDCAESYDDGYKEGFDEGFDAARQEQKDA